MTKITAYLKSGENKFYLENGFIRTNENSRIYLKKLQFIGILKTFIKTIEK